MRPGFTKASPKAATKIFRMRLKVGAMERACFWRKITLQSRRHPLFEQIFPTKHMG